ncbi:MAG: HD domain-containing protein [Clostridia bacterium]|nr:HD domain-containing protein [Clostridia bacterium]
MYYKNRYNVKYTTLLCMISIAINFICGYITTRLGLPLYLDSIGTITAAVFVGYIPAIAVGFLTNLIKCFFDIESIYYGIFNMLIAVCTAFVVQKDYLRKPWKLIILAPVLTIVTCIPDSLLTWFFNDRAIGGTGEAIAVRFSQYIGDLPAQFLADLVVEAADKTISVIIVIFIVLLTPKKIIDRIISVWTRYEQINKNLRMWSKDTMRRTVSLRTKLVAILLFSSMLIASIATAISYMLFRNELIKDHIKLAEGLTSVIVNSIDVDKVDEYIAHGTDAEGYQETLDELYKLRGASTDIEYIYVYKIMEDGCHVVFDLDTEDIEASKPGDIIEFDPSFEKYISALLAGESIEPVLSNDKFGSLLTVYKPVYDSNGVCQCYAAVDVSMNALSTYGYGFAARLISTMLGFFVIVVGFGLWFSERSLIMPINTMAYCVSRFVYNSDDEREQSVERMKQLNIDTGDEIENLYHAFVTTTDETMQYIEDVKNKNETISQMQSGLILVLADLVESRDKCTGDHVRKTAAYVRIIMNEMKRLGIYEDQLTDEFMNDVESAAPLHDVGKIYISDTILNKPGKLTDEEFGIMRSHAALGSEIIDRAIEIVPDSGYLSEAKNLAEYHHEKWNGKGYPNGIAADDIPLSARIMAVADVFDALVSQRSYKQPFTFEQAQDIIRNDAGTHFDPKVVEAFLSAEDEIRAVAEDFSYKYDPNNE